MSARIPTASATPRNEPRTAPTEPCRATCPPIGPVATCSLLLIGIKLSLTLLGYGRTRRIVEVLTPRRPTTPPVPMARVEELERVVALAAALYPGRALCLEQSLTLHALLRRAGVASRLRLGVQSHPFAAHAWIEVGVVPVNDVGEHVRHFTPLPEPVS